MQNSAWNKTADTKHTVTGQQMWDMQTHKMHLEWVKPATQVNELIHIINEDTAWSQSIQL